ncbi:MAG: sensor histidine kinase [Pseudomonadales bacterium]
MRTLFIRVAAIIFVTIFIGIDLIVYIAVSSYLQQLIQQHIEATERVHTILVKELNDKPEAEWQAVIQRVEALLDYRIDIVESKTGAELVGEAPFVEHTQSSLAKDEVAAIWPIPAGGGRSLRYEQTFVVDWKHEDLLLFALLFVALPIVLYLALRPIARKITDLSQVAREYAAGKLDAHSTMPAPRPLEQLADDIHQMARALQLKIQEQNVMTHAISHELKTPLTRMRMANDLALREVDPQAWKEHLIELDDDLTMLEKIMAETLALTRLTFQNVPLTIRALLLHDVVQESLRECATGAVDVEVDIPPGVSVLANPDAIERVFVNVLVNAFRFAHQRVCVSVEARNDQWITTIEDDGPGISVQDRDKIFMPFGRVETSRSRASGSTGMGLAIAALLLQKCEGSIWLDESNMGGARFHIALTADNPRR